MKLIYLVVTIGLAVASTQSGAASFDCKKASTGVEKMICSNAGLSELDDILSQVFQAETEEPDAAPKIRTSQKSWLVQRDTCTTVSCIESQYEQRIAALACSPQSRSAGSAVNSIQCTSYSIGVAERALLSLEDRYLQQTATESNNPEYLRGVFATERKVWKEYRDAQCALYGATEGGSDGWKNAFTGLCALDETKKRIVRLTKELKLK